MLKHTRNIVALLAFLFIGVGSVNAQSLSHNGDRVLYLTVNPLLEQGEKAFRDGRYEASIKLLTKALGPEIRGKQRASVYNAICAAESALGNHTVALEQCSLAIESAATYWRAYVNRGNAQKSLGQTGAAYTDYCAARELAPGKVGGAFVKHCTTNFVAAK